MKKSRFLPLFLSLVMAFSSVPFAMAQVSAEEATDGTETPEVAAPRAMTSGEKIVITDGSSIENLDFPADQMTVTTFKEEPAYVAVTNVVKSSYRLYYTFEDAIMLEPGKYKISADFRPHVYDGTDTYGNPATRTFRMFLYRTEGTTDVIKTTGLATGNGSALFKPLNGAFNWSTVSKEITVTEATKTLLKHIDIVGGTAGDALDGTPYDLKNFTIECISRDGDGTEEPEAGAPKAMASGEKIVLTDGTSIEGFKASNDQMTFTVFTTEPDYVSVSDIKNIVKGRLSYTFDEAVVLEPGVYKLSADFRPHVYDGVDTYGNPATRTFRMFLYRAEGTTDVIKTTGLGGNGSLLFKPLNGALNWTSVSREFTITEETTTLLKHIDLMGGTAGTGLDDTPFDIKNFTFECVSLDSDEVVVNYGDINSDGKITPMDVIYLCRHIAGWDGYAETVVDAAACDLDGDEKVTFYDAGVLARHIAKWKGYETLPYIKPETAE